MNSKTRFIPLVIIGAILLSLLAVVPAFGAGEVSFIDPGDINDRNDGSLDDTTPEAQEWARQGGMAGLMVEDSDLDVPVRRVLLPTDLQPLGRATVEAHSTMISGYTVSGNVLEDDDYVLIGSGTVRQVTVDDQGAVTLDAPYAMRQSGTLHKVNISESVFDDCTDCAMAEMVSAADLSDFGGLAEFTTKNDIVNSGIGETPSRGDQRDVANRLGGADLGSAPDREDVVVIRVPQGGRAELVGVRRVSGKTVSLRVPTADLTANSATLYVAYWSDEQNETGSNVKIGSQALSDDVTVALTETGPTTGKFVLKVNLSDPGTSTSPMFTVGNGMGYLPVNPRDVVSLTHPDQTASLTVETTMPVFASFAPVHNTSGKDDRPEVTAQVTDGDSGLDSKNIKVIFQVTEDGKKTPTTLVPKDNGDVSDIAGGFEVRQRLVNTGSTKIVPEGDAVIEWWVMATDNAGNVGYSDRQASVGGEANPCMVQAGTDIPGGLAAAGCQPFKINVDGSKPKLLQAETGRHWDSSLPTGDSDDKTEYRVSKADATSILVVFNEHLDATTVTASDFEVDGESPIDAEVRNVKVRDDVDNDPDMDGMQGGDGNSSIKGVDVQDAPLGESRGYVFLTVEEMEPNAKPRVELVGDVSDIAGNRQNAGRDSQVTDRVAPTLSVTIMEGDRPVTKDKINLTIMSNENISTPMVTYRMVKSSDDKPMVADSDSTPRPTVVFKSATEYTATIPAPTDGLYTVHVSAQDSSGGNTGTKGDNSGSIDVSSDTSAILFERDKNISAPDFNPDTTEVDSEFSIDDPNAFIRIDFSGEGNEYDATENADGMRIGDDLDTHGKVTIVSATLDGDDISESLQANEGSNIFLFHASGLDLGEHKLRVTAMDEAGNENATPFQGTITISERKPYTLKLNPGWNLVSIPGEPMDSDINAVISADHPATTVLTYDPSVPGGWLTALRGADGSFTGTLTNISAGHAYWIQTPSFEGLKVDIPKQAVGAQILPTISVAQGWNLIPILDVDGDFMLNSADADDYNYFSGLSEGSVTGIYTFNTITNSWSSVAEADVAIGKGYWIYATKAGVIVP